jgi:hypothetical protein
MPEQVFKFPGFYDREIDLSARTVAPSGVPAGVVGASVKGPAFVPITVGTFSDFVTKFGDLNPKFAAPYAVNQFLTNRFAATFVRVLGAGANKTTSDINTTIVQGTVKNAGWKNTPSAAAVPRHNGAVQFIAAKHVVSANEAFGMPMFSDNSSFTLGGGNNAYLVRGMILTANDTRIMVMNGAGETWAQTMDDLANVDAVTTNATLGKFKLVISSSAGSSFSIADGLSGLKILTASLDPSNPDYIGKILNTDPEKFETEKHVLYGDFAVDAEIASVLSGTTAANSSSVAILSGSTATSATSGDTTQQFLSAYGRFDTRYAAPVSPTIISQPFGSTEYDLFSVESLDDGAYANNQVKVSISNIKASSDPRNEYGTFALLVRDFNDTDFEPKVLEQFNNLSLDPDSDQYIASVIGDISVHYNFDVLNEDDRRLVKRGLYPNRSNYIRVKMNSSVENKMIPAKALPFGFRGLQVLKTNDLLTDSAGATARLSASGSIDTRLLSAIVPPVPMRFKTTRGEISGSSIFAGYPGPNEVVDSRLFWGVKFERNDNVLNTNVSNEQNELLQTMVKFKGIAKLDVLVTGSGLDAFSNNKFTLARVALSNQALTDVTGAADTHMKEAAYIRNGTPDASSYMVSDGAITRVTLATLLNKSTSSADFNRFSDYAKFTTVLQGGFDGLNILDKNAARMSDKGTSTETGGGANDSFVSPGLSTNQAGTGNDNNNIFSLQVGVNIITDPMTSNVNVITVPGIRDPFVTDYTATKTRDYQMGMYLMDVPYYDYNSSRIFDGDVGRYIDVNKTADQFESRAVDNNHVAAYFPNVVINDNVNGRRVTVPASVAALAAIGFNDRLSYPWFAPAGFNRAALDFVSLTQTRINQPERDRLYDVRINPIIKFPGESFVIFSQKTLQQAKTSLDSINVKRMILEVKRLVVEVGNKLIFEQLTTQLRDRFVNSVTPLLANVQSKQGIEMFKVVCDDSNNTAQDVDANRINAQIRIVPTRAVEFIAIDFVITNSGVQFV